MQENKKQTAQAETKQTQPQAKKAVPKDLSRQIAERTEQKKKTVEKTTVSTEQIIQAKQNSRA